MRHSHDTGMTSKLKQKYFLVKIWKPQIFLPLPSLKQPKIQLFLESLLFCIDPHIIVNILVAKDQERCSH